MGVLEGDRVRQVTLRKDEEEIFWKMALKFQEQRAARASILLPVPGRSSQRQKEALLLASRAPAGAVMIAQVPEGTDQVSTWIEMGNRAAAKQDWKQVERYFLQAEQYGELNKDNCEH